MRSVGHVVRVELGIRARRRVGLNHRLDELDEVVLQELPREPSEPHTAWVSTFVPLHPTGGRNRANN
eukprot:14482406-Alexandrium_andersonii.AAC.1